MSGVSRGVIILPYPRNRTGPLDSGCDQLKRGRHRGEWEKKKRHRENEINQRLVTGVVRYPQPLKTREKTIRRIVVEVENGVSLAQNSAPKGPECLAAKKKKMENERSLLLKGRTQKRAIKAVGAQDAVALQDNSLRKLCKATGTEDARPR